MYRYINKQFPEAIFHCKKREGASGRERTATGHEVTHMLIQPYVTDTQLIGLRHSMQTDFIKTPLHGLTAINSISNHEDVLHIAIHICWPHGPINEC